MSLLQYTSNEMYSSTELIRKSKTIYDKLSNKEIEKAIILRDGKPSFMLMDFEVYEQIMNEYLQMKGSTTLVSPKKRKEKEIKNIEKVELIETQLIDDKETNTNKKPKDKKVKERLAVNQDALKEVLSNIEKSESKDNSVKSNTIRQKLKEFWD